MMLHTLFATDLAELLLKREVTSVAIVEALYARADDVDGRVHGWVQQLRKQALDEAKERDRERAAGRMRSPIHGLPISVKENIEVFGTDATAGLRARSGKRSTSDAVSIKLLREAGAIVLGKSNVPQTLIAAETVNHMHGTTNNPWNLDRVPGGSSGGESALVASGQSVLGVGTDIGGSVRIPAVFTGVFALKPGANRWSNMGSTGAMPGQEFVRSQVGVLARSAADLSLLSHAIDPVMHAQFDPEVAPLSLEAHGAIDISKLRVGYYEDDGFFTPSAAVRRAVREAADALRAAGATLVPYAPRNAEEIYYLYIAAMSADGLRTLYRELEGEPLIEPLRAMEKMAHVPAAAKHALVKGLRIAGEERTAKLVEALGEKSVADLFVCNARRLQLIREEKKRWREENIDAVLCPAYATPAPQHGKTGEFSVGASYAFRYNLLNLPAGVAPVTRVHVTETNRTPRIDMFDQRAAKIDEASAGLPIGVQIVASNFREDLVLALLAAVEQGCRSSENYPRTPV